MTIQRPKIAVVLRDGLQPWQELNVTAFLISGIAATRPDLIGDPYRDADGQAYLPMLGHPVIVLVASGSDLAAMRARAANRGAPVSIYTLDLFATGNDVDNRAAVADVTTENLDLVGLGIAADRGVVDRVVKGGKRHP